MLWSELSERVSRERLSAWLSDDRGSLKRLRGSGTWMVTGVVRDSPHDERVVLKIFPEGASVDETSVYDHKIHPMREGKRLFVQPLAIVDTTLTDEDPLEKVLREHMRTENVRLLVMERVDGDTLQNVLVDRGVKSEDKVVAVLQLLDAVKIMRANGITHNDLHFQNVMVRDTKQHAGYAVVGVHLATRIRVKVFDWDKSIVEGLVGDARDFNPSYDLVSVVVRLRDTSLTDPLLKKMCEVLLRDFRPLFSRFDMHFEAFAGKEHLVCKLAKADEETSKTGPIILDDENERFVEETPKWCLDNRGWPPAVHGLIPRIRKLQIHLLEEVLGQKVPLVEKIEALYV